MQEMIQALLYIMPVWLSAIIITSLFDRLALFKRDQVSFPSLEEEATLAICVIILTFILWAAIKIFVTDPLAPLIRAMYAEQPEYTLVLYTLLRLSIIGLGFIPIAAALLKNHEGLTTIGLTRFNLRSSVLLGVILSGVTITSYLIIYGKALPVSNANSFSRLCALIICLGVGFSEEAIFRGYLQLRLAAGFGAHWGWLITAIIFTIGHVGQAPSGLISVFIVGLLFGWIMLKSKNIVGLSIWHAFMDWVWVL